MHRLSLLLVLLPGCFPELEEEGGKVREAAADTATDTSADSAPDDTAETDADTDADSDTDTDADTDADTDTDLPVDADGDGVLSDVDCDDGEADVFPGGGEGHTGDARGRDDDCDGEIDELPTVELTTDEWRVWVYLADTWPGEWWFGLAETGDGELGWYGEDCIEDPGDDADYGYELCHPFSGNDLTLGNVDTVGELVEGETTLFYDALLGDVTFYLATEDEALCWVWGDDPDWYVTDTHAGVGPFGCVVE